MLKILLLVAVVLFLASRMLPRLGGLLGREARKPYRQAKWMWNWVAGSEEEALAAEHEYGEECAREFAAQFPGGTRAASRAVVEQVGVQLAAAVQDHRRRFRFAVVTAPTANAYALPGGFIFASEPLLALCERDRDAVAFLLAHEMTHVIAGHARDRIAAGVFLNAVASRLPGAGRMLREVLEKGYSRDLELEADREAVRLAAAAGFDARASLRVLEVLEQASGALPGVAEYLSTHPSYAERREALERALRR